MIVIVTVVVVLAAFGAAIDAHRLCGDAHMALDALKGMYLSNVEPAAAHHNLVLRTLRATVRPLILNLTSALLYQDTPSTPNTSSTHPQHSIDLLFSGSH